MSASASLECYAEQVNAVTSLNRVWHELMHFVEPLGINALAYYHKAPPGAADYSDKYFKAIGFDEELAKDHRRNHKIFGEPFTSHFNPLLEPMFWGDVSQKLNLSDSQLEQLRNFYRPDPSNGLVVPVFGPNSRNGCVVLRFKDHESLFPRDKVHRINFACNQSHIQFCRIKARDSDQSVKLTAREQEVLTWVARGKSNAVIADIVGISQHTVNGYLRRVYLKTQTSDRTTAALRAIGDSLIDY